MPLTATQPLAATGAAFLPHIRGALCAARRGLVVSGRLLFTGAGTLAGTVTRDGVVASRPVRVYDRATGDLVAEMQSADDGTYSFSGEDSGRYSRGFDLGREYLLVALDNPDEQFNAAVADLVTPAAG